MRPLAELHEDGFAAAGGAEDDAGLAALDGEGDVLEDGLDVEGDGDVVEDDDRLSRVRAWLALREIGDCEVVGHGLFYLPKMPIMARLTMKSTMMMKTEETTTAWVVARPTPWVPPLVFMPK